MEKKIWMFLAGLALWISACGGGTINEVTLADLAAEEQVKNVDENTILAAKQACKKNSKCKKEMDATLNVKSDEELLISICSYIDFDGCDK
ncbi:MAG: hypothetical protein HUK21_05800 [Fibrobacteraceae bacterium]|nr:hypothetical protein [Fibrobacteraceae bacterium]